MITIVKSPWEDKFLNLVSECKFSLKITSPYVKDKIVRKIYENKNSEVQIDLITSSKLMNFYRGASDASALNCIIQNGGRVYNYQNLHAKVYIFDEKKVIITSGNLTFGGLQKNYEYGIEVLDTKFITDVISDFNALISSEKTGLMEIEELNKIQQIINSLPKEKIIRLPKIEAEEDDQDSEIFIGDIQLVKDKLNNWQKDVMNCLMKIEKQQFDLNEVYKFEEELKILHPENNTIQHKIRQILQQLRDLGLIQFWGQGHYKKLWI